MHVVHENIDLRISILEEMLKKLLEIQTKASPSEGREAADNHESVSGFRSTRLLRKDYPSLWIRGKAPFNGFKLIFDGKDDGLQDSIYIVVDSVVYFWVDVEERRL
ncbi:hypothetical protein M5K25_007566 [Dendrobium thyrsiflorum]|uniref:Uncharacterized protein n=1 Tax=Dendrobium thyrsiflorum TaxID=117978 RepID=A0ABD0VED0_DENTH